MSYVNIENNFFGREDILEHFRRRIIDLKDGYRQNIAILGDRFLGKSSILENFAANLDDDRIVIVYLDLENKDFSYLFSKFTGGLLYNFSKIMKMPLYDELNLLLETTKTVIPNTVQVIKKIRSDLEKNKLSDCFSGLMLLPEVFTTETGKFCVLILDEFQSLEDLQIPEVFQHLGKKIMTQKKCFYIMASSYPVIAEKILTEKLSLLFGNFETIYINPFDTEESQKFISKSLSEMRMGSQISSFLADFTGGHPLYLNLLCREIVSLGAMHKQEEVYFPLLSQAIENTIFDKWGVISRHFELIINDLCSGKGNAVLLTLMMSVANNHHKLHAIIDDVGIKKTQATQKVNKLIESGILVKNNQFYYFKDKLFKYWIKYVYQKRRNAVELTPDKIRKQFKDEFNKHMDFFKAYSRKDIPTRITELLHCFDNELFSLNGRRYKLPAFENVESLKVKSDSGVYFDILKASTGESSWVIVIKKDIFGERDINLFSNEVKRMGKRPDKCLIISLSEMDENARVKALQEKFWIWNKNEVNALLTLFDKPYL